MKIGVQTYSIRHHAGKDLSASLIKLLEIGIDHVELARIPLTPNTIKIIKDTGIEVMSLQLKLKVLEQKFEHVVKVCESLNTKLVVVSVMPLSAIIGGRKSVLALSKRLNALSNRYRSFDIELAYHHHDFEYHKLDTSTKLDLLMLHTEAHVKLVVDTYWTRKMGYDPKDIIRFYSNRVVALHLRACIPKRKGYRDGVICDGLIDFKGVLETAIHAKYGAIEINSKRPYEDISKSYYYINKLH